MKPMSREERETDAASGKSPPWFGTATVHSEGANVIFSVENVNELGVPVQHVENSGEYGRGEWIRGWLDSAARRYPLARSLTMLDVAGNAIGGRIRHDYDTNVLG